MIKNTHVEEDHVDRQHVTWNLNTEDYVNSQHVTENITAKDHSDGHHVTDITVEQQQPGDLGPTGELN